jgi:PAS domain S-box-containing protein
MLAELHRRAEAQMWKRRKERKANSRDGTLEADPQRLFQELQVHQVELEMQNVELQKTRDELEVMLENYTDLYEFAPVGYFTLAPDGTIRLVNLTGCQLVGIERARLLGRSFGTLVSAGLRPDFNSFLQQVFAGRTNLARDFELVRPGLPPRAVNIEALRLPDGRECRVAVVDISARKQVEEKVRISEVRYRRLFEAAHDGVLLLDPGTRKITDANPFMTELLGYSRDQLVGKELFEIGLLKDEAASQEMFRKLKLKHEVRYEDLPLKSQEGQRQEVEVVANLYQENGAPVIQCNVRDITERRKTERELSEKARLLDLSHDAIIVRDMAGRIRYWNHGAEELYGWSRKEALGKISHRLLQTKFPTPLKQITEELHRADRWIGELVHTKRGGQRITVLVRKTLDRDPQGRPSSVLQNITDITMRKQAEAARRRLEVLAASNQTLEKEIVHRQAVEVSLKQSEEHQRRLLAESRIMQGQLRDLSHQILSAQEEERKKISRELHDEIAQTLAGINIRLGTLKAEGGGRGRDFQHKIDATQRLVEKSVEIVHRFARDLRPTLLDDLGLIPALHAFVKTFTEDTGVRVRITVFAGVEKLDNDRRTVLYRVAQEALTNVDRHAQASTVEVNIQHLADKICMTIRDNGKCPPMDPMRKAKTGKRLGLIGMRERLEMVGGSFEIQSLVGKGTTVRAEVPFGKVRGGGEGISDRVRPS